MSGRVKACCSSHHSKVTKASFLCHRSQYPTCCALPAVTGLRRQNVLCTQIRPARASVDCVLVRITKCHIIEVAHIVGSKGLCREACMGGAVCGRW